MEQKQPTLSINRKEIINKLEKVESEVTEIREILSQSEAKVGTPLDFQLAIEPEFKLEYTLEDLYKAFGNKKALAHRLKTALQKL